MKARYLKLALDLIPDDTELFAVSEDNGLELPLKDLKYFEKERTAWLRVDDDDPELREAIESGEAEVDPTEDTELSVDNVPFFVAEELDLHHPSTAPADGPARVTIIDAEFKVLAK